MKLLKEFKKSNTVKAAQFRECLSKMAKDGSESSFLDYTTEWIKAVNRGGLFEVNDDTFNLFRAIEVKTKEVLPRHLAQASMIKEKPVKAIACDESVQVYWRSVGADIVDEEDGFNLLCRMVDMWLSIRGSSIASKWLEDYKLAKGKNVKRAKSLRKELKMDADSNDN